ncbi:MAG: hypothetical protein M1819_007018 [Sarea resinae]|nr:MAG: hypothetical protein M1819_007018 [Sarea resinae]
MSVFAPKNTALITGAASGIGLAIAQLCRSHGMNLALVDINTAALAEAKKSFTSSAPNPTLTTSTTTSSSTTEEPRPITEAYTMDVSQLEQWQDLQTKVASTFGGIDLLVLNAGTTARGSWGDSEYFSKILSTNLMGPLHGLNTLLPLVRARSTSTSTATAAATVAAPKKEDEKPTAVVLTGSKQGITNPPGNAAYNASKSALKTLAEHLSWDLRDTGTAVHLLVPGWTHTGMTSSSSSSSSPAPKPPGAWTPAQVASYMVTKMAAGKFYILCPDNDVDEVTDKKRMLWSVGDAVHGRPPLSRWRGEWKDRAAEWMAQVDGERLADW